VKTLALIPARGGSKRVPQKNLRSLGGKPLISWTIAAAKSTNVFCDILVSTDDGAIQQLAENEGVMAPWLRPPELASDEAGSVPVAIHALDWYEKERGIIDCLVLLQPTSPFRRPESINEAVKIFEYSNRRSVVSVSPTHHHPHWVFRIKDNTLIPFMDGTAINKRSQDLEPAFVLNGSIYTISPDELRSRQSFLSPHTIPLVNDSAIEAIDIDTERDLEYANLIQSLLVIERKVK
jgi:CMP-N-acetylneuraminic acid synthetase